MERSAELYKGNILDGRFEVCEILKPGRAALALERESGRKVFLKFWNDGDPDAGTERAVLEKLRMPEAPEVIGAFRTGCGVYLAERWVSGKNLEEIVRETGPLDTASALEILEQAAQAVAELHWHGDGPMVFVDLKPGNIMVDGYIGDAYGRKSSAISVSLVDFESVRLAGGGRVVNEGEEDDPETDPGATYRLGSQYFVAPEVLFGEVAQESDIYSLGVILGYMLTGKANYPGAYRIRKPLGELIDRATSPDPADRFGGIKAFLDEIGRLKRGLEAAGTERSGKHRRAAAGILAGIKKRERSGPREESQKSDPAGTRAGSSPEFPADSGAGPAADGDQPEAGPVFRELKGFRRTLAVVEHNPCFAGKLAKIAADAGLRTAVFALSERGRRNVDFYLKGRPPEKNTPELAAESGCFPYIFDHKSMFLHGAEEWKKRGLLECAPGEELYSATYKLGLELPFRTGKDLERFADWCYANFDLTLLSAERSDDERLLETAVRVCSRIISTPDSNVEDMEAARDYFNSRAETGQIMLPKVRYVAWDYSEDALGLEKIEEIVGRDRLLGEVALGSDARRQKNRITDLKPYLDEREKRREAGQYSEILERLIG